MARKTPSKRAVKNTVAMLVDGQTETWYFEMLKRFEESNRDIRINISPKIPQKKTILAQMSEVISMADYHTKIFWIIDFDEVMKRQKEWNNKGERPIDEFYRCKAIVENRFSNVSVIVNNPCTEFWFLLHFESTSKLFEKCDDATKRLKKHLIDYEKTEKYFKSRDNDIYTRLRPFLLKAMENSASLGVFDKSDYSKALSEMYKVFESKEIGLIK